MGESVEVSVVLPAYNEEATLERTVEQTVSTLAEFLPPGTFEVIIAEDGCTDRTPEIAADLAADDDRIRHVHSDDRLGRGRALERAFRDARGQTLAYLDTDLATDLSYLERLIETVRSGDADVATGSRWVPGHVVDRPSKRGVPSYVYNLLSRVILRSTIRDHQCGFKAFDRDALADLLPQVGDNHWFWDTELLVRAQRAGYTVEEFPVEWTPQGDSKVDLVRDVFGMGSQIVRTWWQLSVSPRITRRRTVAAGILMTVLAVALMTQYIDFGLVIDQVESANPVLIGLASLVYLLSWPLRGSRYRDILAELGVREGTGFLTGAIFISQTGNLVFPARAGDAVRAYVMKTRRAVGYPTGFASLAVERVFDLLTITAVAGTVLLGLVATGSTIAPPGSATEEVLRSGRTAVVVAGGVGIAAIIVVIWIVASARSDRNRVRGAINRLSDDSYARYVASVIERFIGDIQTVAVDPGAFARVGLTSVLIWGLDVVTAMIVLLAFSPEVSVGSLVAVSFFAVSVGNLAKVLPLSPGGIGLYEGAFTLLVIGLTPLTWDLALGAAIVDHAVKNVITLIGGVVAMVVLNVSLTTAVEEGRDAAPSDVS